MTTNQNLYLLTVARYKSFYVIAPDPTAAQNKLTNLLNKADWWFVHDREVVDIKLMASELTYFPEDKPSFRTNGTDLIL